MEDKLEEHGLLEDAELHDPSQRKIKIGPFTIHPIEVTHSLVDCVSLAIHTPLGVIIHTGDFKVDPTPTDNRLFDLHAFAEYGKKKVCWRCSRTRLTLSVGAIRPVNARSAANLMKSSPRPSAGYSSPASRPPYIASSSP